MRRLLAVGLVFAMAVLGMPMSAVAAVKTHARQQQTVQSQGGNVQGVARDSHQKALGNYTVRIRNVSTGNIAGTTTTSDAGEFTFRGIPAGNYVVEIVNSRGEVVGTSTALSLAGGATVSVNVTASAVGAIAAAGGGGFSLFGLGTLASVAVITGAGVAVVAGVVAVNRNASPSK